MTPAPGRLAEARAESSVLSTQIVSPGTTGAR